MPAIKREPYRQAFSNYKHLLFPACLLVLACCTLTTYLQTGVNELMIGYAGLVATAQKQRQGFSSGFAAMAVIMLALAWLVPVNTLFYFALAFSLLFWIDCHLAKIHVLGVVALLLSSPAFHSFIGVFSIPLRFQLTKLVGSIFSLSGAGVTIKGSMIFMDGREFAVDPACMGLHMFSLSILLGILLIGLLQRKSGKGISIPYSILYLLSLVLLNLVANMLRITALVFFVIPPGVVMHDIVGLLCLLLYVCLPACYLGKLIISRSGYPHSGDKSSMFKFKLPVQWLVVIYLVALAQRVSGTDTYASFTNNPETVVPRYTLSHYGPGIVKLANKTALVYVKYIRGFYDTEHNPAFCWTGSGYTLKEVQKGLVNNEEVYTATLCKGQEKLYTAWWYGSGSTTTISQWQWRWDMLRTKQRYALINTTAASRTSLMAEVENLFQSNSLRPLLAK